MSSNTETARSPYAVNVLIYDGPGVSPSCLLHLRKTLTALLSPRYDILTVSPKAIISDPWTTNCALVCFPGGRDLGYLSSLGEAGCSRIADWVRQGGRYLGLCAGAYFACGRVEFEQGRAGYEVIGDRLLRFYPGTCKGAAFDGFVYDTEEGARDASIDLDSDVWEGVHAKVPLPNTMHVYHNGGGFFEETTFDDITILARYTDLPNRPPAGVLCRVGSADAGKAVLWAIHPEHPPVNDTPSPAKGSSSETRIHASISLMKATLHLLDLDIPTERQALIGTTPLFLAASEPETAALLASEIHSRFPNSIPPERYIDLHDTFNFYGQAEMDSISGRVRRIENNDLDVIVCEKGSPEPYRTPIFDIASYLSLLTAARLSKISSFKPSFGSPLFYGEVVTSTQTVLEKNPRLLSALPSGFVFVGSHQIAGRGRGTNNWLSPPGCLQFSLVLRAPKSLGPKLVFVQYLFGLSVIEAVRRLHGYENVDMRLKWPNDIYADLGEEHGGLRKVGGILVNSMFAGGDFTVIIGCGINTTNSGPTTSLLDLITSHNHRTGANLPAISQEQLLANILAQFELFWSLFESEGDFGPFARLYTNRWLHSDKEVVVQETGQRVRIIGLTPENGMLRTQVLGSTDATPTFVDLQPDGNSFDMMQGLLKAKR